MKASTAENKLSVKKNIASMQVIRTLQLLMQDTYTMNELIAKLNADSDINGVTPYVNNSVVSKYINTCRTCGFEIPKIQNRYHVGKIPFGLDLSNKDFELLEEMQNTVKDSMSEKNAKLFDSFINKLKKYSNEKISKVDQSNYNVAVELFEQAVRDKRKVLIMLRNGRNIECIPKKVYDSKSKTIFSVVIDRQERNYDLNKVVAVKILSDKFITTGESDMVVIFKLTTPLSERYELREYERLVDMPGEGNCIYVANKGENKEELFARLLRYDSLCEIISPAAYRNEFIQTVQNALKNYGEL